MTLSWLQGANGNILPSAPVVLVTQSCPAEAHPPCVTRGAAGMHWGSNTCPSPHGISARLLLQCLFHSSAELSVGKGPHRNSHFQKEVYFPVKSECTLLATDGASARQRHSWHWLNFHSRVVAVEKFSEKLLDAFSVAVLNSMVNNEVCCAAIFFHGVVNGFCAKMNFNNFCSMPLVKMKQKKPSYWTRLLRLESIADILKPCCHA